ncbi:MAG: VanW family protein [Armatimonadota bacterium]
MSAKKSFRIGITVAAGLALALVIGIKFSFLASGRIAPGVRVVGVNVGGLTQDEAANQLRGWARKQLAANLEITAAERRWTGALGDIGVTVDTKKMAAEAYSIGRRGILPVRLVEGLGILRGTADLGVRYRYHNDKLRELIDKINSAVAVPARDAKLSFDDGYRSITPEAAGTAVDPVNAIELIKTAVDRNESRVILPIAVDKPEVTAADLTQVDTLLSRYTTRFTAWRTDRTHNVKLAAASINGKLVKRGGIFSYNDTVGPRVKENGFRDALIYVKGKIIPGTGGGICQVSSTVYNAALLANLKIIERSNHSMPVPYVPMGRDATVAYGLLDLKFRNNTSAPIYIATKVRGSYLTVEIYGASESKRDVQILTSAPKQIHRANGTVVTAVSVYRVLREDGAEPVKEHISYDRYSPAPPHETEQKPKPRSRSTGQA